MTKRQADRRNNPGGGNPLERRGIAPVVVQQLSHGFHNLDAYDPTKLQTVYHQREAGFEIQKRIDQSRIPYQRKPAVASASFYRTVLPMPTRGIPRPNSKEEARERFKQWQHSIYDSYPPDRLNRFENNLGVWQQLWRTCERSHVIVLCVDARHPLFHFPPSLYRYVTEEVQKPFIVALNKIDMVSKSYLDQWIAYFDRKYPKVTVVPLTAFPVDETVTCEDLGRFQTRKRKIVKRTTVGNAYGTEALTDTWKELEAKVVAQREQLLAEEQLRIEAFDAGLEVKDVQVKSTAAHTPELDNVKALDGDDSEDLYDDDKGSSNATKTTAGTASGGPAAAAAAAAPAKPKTKRQLRRARRHTERLPEYLVNHDHSDDEDQEDEIRRYKHEMRRRGKFIQALPRLVIGMIGHPNAGKSTLINALCGEKVVGVSATPGKTKHIQTIEMSPSVTMCDCPGLVFPAVDMPRALQVLCGIFPISQVREPYSAVQYLAERTELAAILNIKPPVVAAPAMIDPLDLELQGLMDDDIKQPDYAWSAWTICEEYARARNYRLRQGVLDTHRAANDILHDTVNGAIVLQFEPPSVEMEQADAADSKNSATAAQSGSNVQQANSAAPPAQQQPKELVFQTIGTRKPTLSVASRRAKYRELARQKESSTSASASASASAPAE
jgi:ribosome biogenesis GTPase A